MIFLAFFTIVFLGVGLGAFIGLLICAQVEIGDFVFTDTRRDLLKCVVVSATTAAAGVGLFALSRNPRAFIALAPVWFVALKACWFDLQPAEIGVIAASSVGSLAILTVLARAVLVS